MSGGGGKTELRLHLVRHGQTEWSLSGRHTGKTDIPLTGQGEAEARALASWLAPIPFDHVFTSPLQRARRTCTLAGLGAAAEIEPDLTEWDYGEYEGVTSKDIVKTRPGWTVFEDGAPGGESPTDIAARADRLLERLRTLNGNVALFSHGHFSSVLAARWCQQPVLEGRRFALATASLSILGYGPGHPETSAILLWNASPASLPTPILLKS